MSVLPRGFATTVEYFFLMKITGHTVLVTGGASGIGLAFAKRFLAEGNEVIVCGRREHKLREAQAAHPALVIRACDLGDADQRAQFAAWVTETFPALDVLVNNAGIQQRVSLAGDITWKALHEEISINLEAPIHLSMLLLPHLRTQAQPAIVNISSGLAFVPLAATPVYSATKAAIHSYTLSLRHQLSTTNVEVIEIAPPAVNTDLGGPGLHTWATPLHEFADVAFARLRAGEIEIGHGFSIEAMRASYEDRQRIFDRMNKH
jgi:uncharacterized oxidoreductase